MNRKKLIIAAVLSCIMIAGCGNNTSSNESSQPVSDSSNDSTTSEPESNNDSSTSDDSGISDISDTDISSSTSYPISSDSSSSSSEDSSDLSDSSDSSDSVSKPEQIFVPADYKYKYANDDLFIGDSIFTGLNLYGFLDEHNVVAKIGFTPYRAHHNTMVYYDGTAVDYAGYIKPKHINIMLGSNCLTVPSMMEDYRELIDALKKIAPDSKICVISVPPVTKNSSAADSAGITNKMIDDINEQIKEMCDETNISYFDLNTQLSNDEGYFKEEYAEVDGLHFKVNTYNVLLNGVEQLWDKSEWTQTEGELQ